MRGEGDGQQGADPGPGRRLLREHHAGKTSTPRRTPSATPGACSARRSCGNLVDCQPRLLPDRQPLHRGVRGRPRRLPRRVRRPVRQLRLVGEPRRADRADVAEARRAPPEARRRGHHRRRRIPDDGRADRAERPRAGVRGRATSATTTPTRSSLRAAVAPSDPGDHDRPHAGRALRPGRGHGARRRARPVARRGQLRRPGLAVSATGSPARSATWRRCRSIRAHHITMGEGGWWSPTTRTWPASPARSATGAATATAPAARTTPAASASRQQFGTLPYGYDHKYVYSHLGYNLKVTDMQAAIGCAQLARLDGFVEARKRNHALL